MDKRYQVFVSSTFADLQDERQAVMQALLSLDHFPAGMEMFPAADDDQWALIQGVIDDSDYYVLVIGGRYGSVSEKGISYTEMEFDYALAKRIPILAFIHGQPEEIAAKKTDQNDVLRDRLEQFRKKVQTGRTVKFFTNADQLKAHVIQSVSAETKRNPREGWVRANEVGDPATMEALRQEVDRLNIQLGTASLSPPPGSQQYAGGSDQFKILYNFRNDGNKDYAEFELSWNVIFREVGPLMMEEASEAQMRNRL